MQDRMREEVRTLLGRQIERQLLLSPGRFSPVKPRQHRASPRCYHFGVELLVPARWARRFHQGLRYNNIQRRQWCHQQPDI